MKYTKPCFLASGSPGSMEAIELLKKKYPSVDINKADVLICLGGDGFLLHTLHTYPNLNIPIFGMNRGTLGFLLNEYREDDLMKRVNKTQELYLCPIRMEATDISGNKTTLKAFNEVSVIRYSAQSANLKLSVDGNVAFEKLSCDGILVSTPAGSTAYNFSAHGPIIPLNANLLALTPVSPFRPRRWKGALLPNSSVVEIENLDTTKRPIGAAADSLEVKDVRHIRVWQDQGDKRLLLFDEKQSLEDRIFKEQFSI